MTIRTHFVTNITVEKVSVDDGTGRGDDRRSKVTLARVVTSSADLPSLITKAGQHLALVEDGGDIDGGHLR